MVKHWPEYVERTFEKSPDDMVHQLRKMVEEKATLEVIAHKVRGQTVKPMDSRPLGDLEFVKLEELLPIYEEKLKAWWEAKNAGQVGQQLSNQAAANHDANMDQHAKTQRQMAECVNKLREKMDSKFSGRGKKAEMMTVAFLPCHDGDHFKNADDFYESCSKGVSVAPRRRGQHVNHK